MTDASQGTATVEARCVVQLGTVPPAALANALRGKLREVTDGSGRNGARILASLKRELSDYDAATGKWRAGR